METQTEQGEEVRDVIREELMSIAEEHGGMLRPADVVEFARDPGTALHSKFTWDDGEAAEQYRLWQARRVIRCSVVVIPEKQQEYKAFVSLTPDRNGITGGYRSIRSVVSNRDLREQLLEDAIREMKVFRRKYAQLKELSEVFSAMDTYLAAG